MPKPQTLNPNVSTHAGRFHLKALHFTLLQMRTHSVLVRQHIILREHILVKTQSDLGRFAHSREHIP